MGFRRLGATVLLISTVSAGQPAPWEPAISLDGSAVHVRPVLAAKTIRDSIEILQTEHCDARAIGHTVQLSGTCEFFSGIYLATLKGGKDDATVKVAFPFSVSQRGAGKALLVDAAEVVD